MYSKKMLASWADMDFNSHMKGTAYLDKACDVRLMFMAENGFPVSELVRLNFGPVAMKDELEYFKEVGLLQEISVTLTLAGSSVDGSRWLLRHEILRPEGKLCARVTSSGGWLDLVARKLVAPPEALCAVWSSLSKTSDYKELPSSVTGRG